MKNNKIQDYLIFTDLDGTLLNHNNYSFQEAQEMLSIIKKTQTPLIIVTSKTKEEVIELQKLLNISTPFIVENGAGIFISKQEEDNECFEMIALGKLYEETLKFFNNYAKVVKMKGFYQMSNEEVAKLTGLSLHKAVLARKRTFSEPFILEDESKLEELKKLANKDGFDIVKGGRFYHLITKGLDKANALREMKTYYEKHDNKSYKTIALGDGENDLTMLAAATQAVLIKKHDNSYIQCDIPDVIKSDFIGPKGWNDSLKRYFKC